MILLVFLDVAARWFDLISFVEQPPLVKGATLSCNVKIVVFTTPKTNMATENYNL